MKGGSSFELSIEGLVFDEEALLSPSIPYFVSDVPQYRAAWQFCKDWLGGNEAFELQTSGSTGVPKRMQVRRSRLQASAESAGRFLGYMPGESSLLGLNAAFVGGIMVLVRGMAHGFRVEVVKPSSAVVPDLEEEHAYRHVSVSPMQLQAALATPEGRRRLERFTTVLIGGADLDPALRREAARVRGPRLYQTFGMTETLSHFALRHLNAPEPELWYRLLPGARIELSAQSELIVDWPGVTEGPVHTHDLAEKLDFQRFIWKGRTDFTINSGGVKIQPEEVEAVAREILTEMVEGRELVLIPLPDARLGQKAVLVLEGGSLPQLKRDSLLARFKAALPPYHAPKEVFFLAEFARTPTGKPNRRAIAEVILKTLKP